MPRIRKKTTNRTTTRDRKKVQNKIKETKRKKVKAAKKNPQWKSKHKKDPGIPNNFPYKDQILAEVAEQRRAALDEKQKLKDEKRAGKAALKSRSEDPLNQEQTGDKSLDAGEDAIASLSAKHLIYANATTRVTPSPVEDSVDDVPILYNRDFPTLKSVLDAADVVLHVIDARMPLGTRSAHLESLMKDKPSCRFAFVLNKIDLCPREAVTAWLKCLRQDAPTFPFRSASAFLPPSYDQSKPSSKSKGSFNDAVGLGPLLEQLKQWATSATADKPLVIAVVGLTNVGKSAFTNSLVRQGALPIYLLATSSPSPSTTGLCQEVNLDLDGRTVRIIDTPGLLWENAEGPKDALVRARDILLRNKGRIDKLKDPAPVLAHIVNCSHVEDLMVLYNLPAFAKGDQASFLGSLARSNQLVKKRGELDLAGASRIVLRDWCTGKFPYHTPPPSDLPKSEVEDSNSQDYDILSTLLPRKEKRKANGLVRFTIGGVESRNLLLDEPWPAFGSDESGSEGEGANSDEEQSGSDKFGSAMEEDEESAEESEHDMLDPPLTGQKRKHIDNAPTKLAPKKVAFGRQTKQKPTQGIPKSILKMPQPKRPVTTSKKSANVAPQSGSRNMGGDQYDFSKFF
ncbi:hypothetical protein BDN72DRAFT_833399 [Pluteus cervinus]|uniref:Uncharacterized protein n=1 Tax=Pluteus cervinus TaxID=181527 RepID=A0ACD3BA11_9AGAR|nr:hypothetical protein BDN72DRAFT_833399 [Pluteus cervinus]